MLADVDGTNIRELLPHARFESASWSPSGTELAVIVDNGGVAELWILTADGRTPARSIEMSVEPHGWVDWRPPDGRELVFRGRTGSDAFAIYTIPPEGGEPTRISSVGSGQRWMGSFALDPDGSRIAFTGWVGPIVTLQVLDVGAPTGPHRMFSNLPLPATDVGVGPVHDGDGVYSPDGSKVVFGRYWDEHGGTINHQLWMASADGDGSDAVPITPVTRSAGGVNPFGQVFSPDATRIVIRIDPSRTAMVLDPRTGSSEELEWSEDTPAWQRVAP
jgi:Tol biopolymer transport system component